MGLFSSMNDKSKDAISKIMLEADDQYAKYEESIRFFGGKVDPVIQNAYKFFKERMQSLLSSR